MGDVMKYMTLVALSSCAVWWLACGEVTDANDAGFDADVSISIDASTDFADAVPVAPNLNVSPLAYGFGPVAVSTSSAPATFTFGNSGTAAATGCAAPVIGGANAGDFTIVTDNCGTNDLAAGGGTCTVLLSVTPSAAGARTMTLSRTCAVGGAVSTTADAIEVNRPMYVFISSVSYDGNLGGLTGADNLCNSLGAAGTLSGPLNKTWKALLSKTTGGVVNAKDRFVWTGPMFDLNGVMVTRDPSAWPWIDAGANSEIGVNESGGGPDDSYVWTGSTVNGVTRGAGFDCNDWSDATGAFDGWSGETSNFPSSSWFDSFGNGCGDTWFGLYCVSE